ncbi:MAG: type II toxin-antitoxin system HicA family toxin [Sneathiella sp.]|nr:type II toxin-antitoxin system HicA family toxin [Sneathiella sp.]
MLKSRDVIRIIESEGWVLVRVSKSSHHQFRHPAKKGLITVPHPKKSLPIGTLRSIERVRGARFK